jgi:hypothetical protein
MLNADSSAENSDTELQSSATAPTTDSAVAFCCTASTTFTIDSTDWSGNTSSRYETRALDESAWLRKPSIERARKMSGTNDASAK